MKGLFTKDVRLMLQRKKTILLFVILTVFMAMIQDDTFVVGYFTILMASLFLGTTLSYDEMDNSTVFLMSLPVTRKMYVKEKYWFSMAGAMIGWSVALLITLITMHFGHEKVDWADFIPSVLVFIPIVMVLISFMLPVQLKFGAERSRIIFVGILALFFGLIIFSFHAITVSTVDVSGAIDTVERMPDIAIPGGMFLAALVIMIISYMISLRIMKNKEF